MTSGFGLEWVRIDCPACGESIEVLVDCSIPAQSYIEDCSVCCRPMLLSVQVGDSGRVQVDARDENAC